MGSGSSKSPGARRGHEAITDEQRMFVWGGERRDERTNAWKLCSKQEMHVLDLVRREWCVYATKSKDGPPPTGHGRCAAIGRMVYSYGGIVDLKRNRLTGELYRFDTSGFAWTRVNVDGAKPASRSNCGLCAVRDQLIMIGGYVDRTSARVQEGAAWINDSSTPGCGWSNECYQFDSIRSCWWPLDTVGVKPHPCSGHTLNAISNETVAMFGGRSAGRRLDQLQILNIRLQIWTPVTRSLLSTHPWPKPTSSHAALILPLQPSGKPAMLILGGLKESTDDADKETGYLIDLETGMVRQLFVGHSPIQQHLHAAAWIQQSNGSYLIIIQGGMAPTGGLSSDIFAYVWNPDNPTVFERYYPPVSPSSSYVSSSQYLPTFDSALGTLRNMKRKSSKSSSSAFDSAADDLHLAHQAMEAEKASLEQNVVELQKRVRTLSMNSHQEMTDLKDQLEIETKARKEEQEHHHSAVARLLDDLQRKEAEFGELRCEKDNEIEQLRNCTQLLKDHIVRLESQIPLMKRQVKALQESKEEMETQLDDYLSLLNIPQEQVVVNESRKLGEGSFGSVAPGMWKGGVVAVKRFFSVIMHAHTQRLCRQELSICCRIRHPNIVTVYGASMVDETPLLIIMELLEASASEVIAAAWATGCYLTHREQICLADGAVAGIAFLHNLSPSYVHGDVKTGNVLVTRSMTAKIGDLGASHVLGDSLSAGAMSPNYAPPERFDDPTQGSSLATDVYSLGVTIGEIFCGEAAARDARFSQLARIKNLELLDLCSRMVVKEANQRPSAWTVHNEIQALKGKDEYEGCSPERIVIGKSVGDVVTLVNRVQKLKIYI